MTKITKRNLILPLLFILLQTFSGNSYAELSKTVEVAIVNVKFGESSSCSGFDDTTDPPWLIFLKEGQNTAKAKITPSTAATEVDFESGDTNKATVLPISASGSPQTIIVKGVAKGDTNVKAKADNTEAGTLNISVKERKTIKVALHYMKDNAGHSTTRSNVSAQNVIDEMNAHWTPQANIVFTKFAVDDPTVPKDLGNIVGEVPTATGEWLDITAFVTAGADMNIFFVWEFETDADPATDSADGGTAGSNVLIEDNTAMTVGRDAAHEAGHVFGVSPSDYNPPVTGGQLMDAYGSGCKIVKSEVDQANQ